MVQITSKAPHSGDPKNLRTRTPDSIVWKDTEARELVSSIRFSWDKYQRTIFVEFLKEVGLGFKNADIKPLLKSLNLDGYDEIENKHGQNVAALIKEKVYRKLKNTADELGEDVLRRATFGPKEVEPSPREEPSDNDSTSDATRQSYSTGMPTPTPSPPPPSSAKPDIISSNRNIWLPDHIFSGKPRPTELNPPFLKMPKGQVPIYPPSVEPTIKWEPKDISPNISRTSRASSMSRTAPKIQFDSGDSTRTFKFRGVNTPRRSPTPSRGKDDVNDRDPAKSTRVKKAVDSLASWSKHTEDALEEAEDAIIALGADEDVSDLMQKIANLKIGLRAFHAGVEKIEDLAAKL
ncbi:hypothetical protein M434DRAFT_14273 [Hypoxylon sp. CO27-5]|nr:hypothetical protein M434DRAFT_14273 [Hypoxylon sp. CO27-5]